MEYNKIVQMIYELDCSYTCQFGDHPKFLHIHPETLHSLAMGSVRARDGMFHRTFNGEEMFMDYRIDKDASMPTDVVTLDSCIKYSIKIKYNVEREWYYVQAVKLDGSPIGKPYIAETIEQAKRGAESIMFNLRQEYECIEVMPAYL